MSDPEDDPRGSLRPTSGRALAISAVVGLASGWGLHPLGRAVTGESPRVSWLQPLALTLVAAILAFLSEGDDD